VSVWKASRCISQVHTNLFNVRLWIIIHRKSWSPYGVERQFRVKKTIPTHTHTNNEKTTDIGMGPQHRIHIWRALTYIVSTFGFAISGVCIRIIGHVCVKLNGQNFQSQWWAICSSGVNKITCQLVILYRRSKSLYSPHMLLNTANVLIYMENTCCRWTFTRCQQTFIFSSPLQSKYVWLHLISASI
jgi:hypothetical protein